MAGVTFNQIPAGTIRVPGIYNEFANPAPIGQSPLRTLLIGQTIRATLQQPRLAPSLSYVRQLCGRGSMIAGMYEAERKNDPEGEVWIYPLPDDGAAVAATGTVALAGTATAAGTLALYIGGNAYPTLVTSGMTAAQLATAAAAVVNADPDAYVTASAATGTLTATAKNLGLLGNDIDIRLNYQGAKGGEQTPAGITATITGMAGGTTDPDLATALARLKSMPFEVICHPYVGQTDTNEVTAFMSFATGRWSWSQQLYGHVITAMRGAPSSSSEATAVSNLATAGAALNDPHLTVYGFYDIPNPSWEYAAGKAGATIVAVNADNAPPPLKTIPIEGISPPNPANVFSWSDMNTLLSAGIAVSTVDPGGTIRIGRAITTYQKDADGITDVTYLDSETMFASAAIIRYFRQKLAATFPRCKLAPDGTNFGAAKSPIVTPKSATAVVDAAYSDMIGFGWVSDLAGFQAKRVVMINPQAPTELDMYLPDDIIPGLMAIASQTAISLG